MAKLTLTDALRADYDDLFQGCTINAGKQATVEKLVDSLLANKGRYAAVGGQIGVPWHMVAVIHNMESSQSFKGHLHNGDPLTARTKQVPKGYPKTGNPPFTWEESAIDALTLHGLQKWSDWTVPGTLYQLETYNGVGYRLFHPQVKSPYLWSFSNRYTSGKYVADGTWSNSAVSQQCGAAVLLRRMIERGLIGFTDQPLPAPLAAPVPPPPVPAPPPPAQPAPVVIVTPAGPLVSTYAKKKPTDDAVIAKGKALQNWLSTFPGIFLTPDGWTGEKTSNAYKVVTGNFLPGDPRI